MKDYERKYKQALIRATREFDCAQTDSTKNVIQTIFPELAESEDERIRKWCISHFRECFRVSKDNVEYQEYLNNKVIPWLEKQEWSEEDNAMLISIENILIGRGHSFHDKEINWLKSLRPQNRWNPSDEQMKALEKTLKYFQMLNAFGETIDGLKELQKQLKKLKEE